MKVTKNKSLGAGHSIEVGSATWDASKTSVRNRYSTSKGGFSPRSSSEIPLGDIEKIMKFIADEDLLEPKVLAEMVEAISKSIGNYSA